MTLNSRNAHEVEKFVDLGLKFKAEPLVMLVANPYQTIEFQNKYLHFSAIQFQTIEKAVLNSIPKVRGAGFDDAELYLNELLKRLRYHKDSDNQMLNFGVKKVARNVFHALPEQLQIPVRKWVQKKRVRKFARLDN